MDPKPAFLSTKVDRGDYYFLNLAPDPASELEVVCGGREICGHDYVVDRTGFRWWSVEFVASGLGQATIGGVSVPLVPGTVFFYGPTTAHRLQVQQGSTMVKYFVDFVGHGAEPLVKRAFPDGGSCLVTAGSRVQRLFEDLKASASTLGDSKPTVCRLLVQQLLVMLPDKTMSSPFEDRELLRKFQTIKAKLAEQALEGATVEEVARSCSVSPSYLARLFRQFDQETPHRYILRCRMAFAASLLLDPQLLVKEVATMAGYDDPYHFSRTFKSIYGQSPNTFRGLRN